MNKTLLFLLLMIPMHLFSLPLKGGTVFTNSAQVFVGPYLVAQDQSVLTNGYFYGLSPLFSAGITYTSFPGMIYKIPFSVTNLANDADNFAWLHADFLSNNTGYSGGAWSCSLEVSAVTQGTNYIIPFASFGEGAILNFNLVVYIPLTAPLGSTGYFTISASTSNTPAVKYNGLNGTVYGGTNLSAKNIIVAVNSPNGIAKLYASDAVDTIDVFDGTKGLRKSKQSITALTRNAVSNLQSMFLWYAVNSQADGSGGANTSDKSLRMKSITSKEFQTEIFDSDIQKGTNLTFLFEMDGITYTTNLSYKLLTMGDQGDYQTTLMHNIAAPGETIYIKVPDKLVGKEGKIYIFSVGGDLVTTLSSGILENQIIGWDGKDRVKAAVGKGMYFIVIEFADLKEVRKVFVK